MVQILHFRTYFVVVGTLDLELSFMELHVNFILAETCGRDADLVGFISSFHDVLGWIVSCVGGHVDVASDPIEQAVNAHGVAVEGGEVKRSDFCHFFLLFKLSKND